MAVKKLTAYTPFWLYRFFDWLERLPVPLWLLGVLVIFIGGLALHLDAWRQGLVPLGEFNSYLATVSLFIVGYPAVWIFLDRRAKPALKDFFQKQHKSQSEVEAIIADFVSLPSLPANLVFLIGLVVGYFALLNARLISPLAGRVLPAWDLISWFPITGLMFMLLYRTLRQAVLMPRFFRENDIDIFNPTPVYALSRYASQASIALIVVNYALVFSSLPALLTTPEGFVYQITIIGLSLIYFFAPLTSINQRLRREKERLLAEIGEDLEDVHKRVHTAVKKRKFSVVNELRNTVSTLKDQQDIVQRIPAWPWRPDTLRNLLTPLLIPILVYLVQRFLGGLFGL